MKAEIITCNYMYENGKCVGGYHETHKVSYISGTSHLIATIDSIIKNNLLYGCSDTILKSVMVGCDDHNAVGYISQHREHIFNYPNINVSIALQQY